MRRLNRKLLAWLVLATVAVGVGMHLLHGVQVRRFARIFLLAADRAEVDGSPEQAAKWLGRYLTFVPADQAARARYGLALHQMARSRPARRRVLDVLVPVLQAEPERHDLRRVCARVALDLEQLADAREHLQVLHREFPDDAESAHLLGQCYEAAGQYPQAVECLTRAVQQDQARVASYALLADVLHQRLRESDQADAVMAELVQANGRSAEAWLARARYRLRRAGYGSESASATPDPDSARALDAAGEDVAAALKCAPDAAAVLAAAAELALLRARLAGTAQAAAHLDTARAHLERGTRLHPDDAQLHLALAGVELYSERRPEAASCLRRAAELLPRRSPAQADVHWRLADLLLRGDDPGHRGEALELLERLRQERYSPAHLEYLAARLLVLEGKWLEAARSLEGLRPRLAASATARPLTRSADLLLGECYQHLGDVDRQYESFRRAAPADPSDPAWGPARLGMASALAALDWIDEAQEEYRKLLPRAPKLIVVVARLQLLRLLRLPKERRDWAGLGAMLAEADRVAPDSAEVALLRADALMAESPDQLDRARAILTAARDKDPTQVKLWTALAAVAERQGQPDAALDVLARAERQLGDHVDLRLARCRSWVRRGTPEARAALAALGKIPEHYTPEQEQRLLYGLADAHIQLGDVEQARAVCDRLAALRPDDLRIRLAMFDLALQAGDDAALGRVLDDVRRIEGAESTLFDYGTARHLIWRAAHGDKSGLARARSLLGGLTTRRPTWSRVPLALAAADEMDGDRNNAITHYLRAIDLGERNPTFVRRCVELLYERQRYLEADQIVRKLPEMALVGDLQRLAAAVSLQNHDYDRALTLAEQAVEARSKDYRDYIWLGQVLSALPGRRAEAEPVLRRAVELAPDVPDVWVALVQHQARSDRGKAEKTLQDAEKALASDKAPLALAQCYEAVRRTDRAGELYQAALTARPDDVTALQCCIAFFLRTGRPAEAQPHLRQLIALKDKAPEEAAWAQLTLSFVLGMSGDLRQSRQALELVEQAEGADDVARQRTRAVVLAARKNRADRRQAITILEQLAGSRPLTADDQFLLAQLYESVGDWPKARDGLLSLVTADKENRRYLVTFVRALLRHKETTRAQFWLDKLQQQDPNSLQTLELRALALKEEGKTDAATALVRAYVEKRPGSEVPPEECLRLGGLLENLVQEEAEGLYRAYAERCGKPQGALVLAQYLGRAGRSQEALALCERAWQTCPPETVAGVSVGLLDGPSPNGSQCERVGRWLEAALKQRPGSAALVGYLAVLRKIQGRYPESEALFRKAIEGDNPGVSTASLNNLAWLLALHLDRGPEALKLIDRALELSGPQAHLLDTRAVVYLKLGQTDQAVKDLETATAEAATPTMYFHLAQAHWLARNRAAAAAAWHRAQVLGFKSDALDPLERPAHDQLVVALSN